MGKIMKFKRSEDVSDEKKFVYDLYDCLTRTIDGVVGTDVMKSLALTEWHTMVEIYLWPEILDEDSEDEDSLDELIKE